MIVIGLTGSIATGKSVVADLFRDEGVPIHDADRTVHDLMAVSGQAAEPVGEAFPEARTEDGGIDRSVLGRLVFDNDAHRRQLEQILHPLVAMMRDQWLAQKKLAKYRFVGIDVPLLFETGGEVNCDVTVVSSCGNYLQRKRALERPNMTTERFETILALQMPDSIKCQKADFIVPTEFGFTASRWYVRHILAILKGRYCA